MARTLGQFYNMDSFEDAKKYFQSLDSNGGIVLGRNLEHISPTIFEQKVAGVTFLEQGITVNNEGGYADAITKLKVNAQGEFKLAGQNTNSNGKISIGMESDTIPVFSYEGNSDWSEMDIKKAELQNINLIQRFVGAHDIIYKQTIDTIGYLGQAGKTEGLLNFSDFSSDSAAKTFATSTGQEMYDELRELIQSQRSSVLLDAVFSCDRLVMHPDTFQQINGTFINTAGGLSTVKEAIERTQNVTIGVTPKAEIGGVKRVVAYSSSEQAMQMRIPVQLSLSNTDQRGFRYYIESMFAVAGLDLIEGDSGAILTGV